MLSFVNWFLAFWKILTQKHLYHLIFPWILTYIFHKHLSKTLCCSSVFANLCVEVFCFDGVAWASYQIRKFAGCACAGNAGNVFPCRRFQRKPLVSDPGMHHGTCVTHVPWCMSGSLTCGDRENVPGIPGACAPAMLRIWQEAHVITLHDIPISCGFNACHVINI